MSVVDLREVGQLQDYGQRIPIKQQLENLPSGKGLMLPATKYSNIKKYRAEGFTIKWTEDKKNIVIFKTPKK